MPSAPGHFLRNKTFFLICITAIGAALRFYNYTTLSFFNDELSALTRLHFDNFHDLITKGVMPDMHPAGIQLFLYMITRLFGTSEAAVRLPFVLAGIGAIPLIYLVGKNWFNSATGLLAAASLAVLQYPVYFSQLARPYSIGLFMGLLMVYSLSLLEKSRVIKPKTYVYFVFLLSGTACMYIHYFSFLFAGIVGITGIFLVPREGLKKYLLCGLGMVLLAAPHYPVYRYQLMVGGLGGPEGWLAPPDINTFSNYIHYMFNDSWLLYFLLPGICISSFVIYRKTLVLSRYHMVCILLFAIPFLVAYFYSVYVNPVLQFSILLFSFPCLLLFLFSFLPPHMEFKKLVSLLFIILATGCYSTVIEKKFYRTEHVAVFRELALRAIELNNKYGDRNITNTINVFEPYYINYYFDKFKRPVVMAQYRCMEPERLGEFKEIVNNSTTPYFLHAWSNTYEPPEIEEIILQQYPFRLVHDVHFNSALSFYSKIASGSAVSPTVIFRALHDFENNRWPGDEVFRSSEYRHAGQFSADLSNQEYGNTFVTRLNKIGYTRGALLSVSLWVYSNEPVTEAQMVASVTNLSGQKVFWQSGKFDTFITKPGTWQQVFFSCIPAGNLTGDDELKIFPWNIKKKKIWIDDIEIKLSLP